MFPLKQFVHCIIFDEWSTYIPNFVVSVSALTCLKKMDLSLKFTVPKSCNYCVNKGTPPSGICDLR